MTSFTLRDFDTILADYVSYFHGSSGVVTDFTEGSVLRTLSEAVSIELSRFYYDALVGLNDTQEKSAYVTFGFPPLPSVQAYGTVLLTTNSTQDVVIPTNATVSVSGDSNYRYTVLSTVTLTQTAPTAEVSVRAILPGKLYNVVAGSINTYDGNPGVTVTNPRAFITGADAETDLERRARFAVFLTSLPRATREAILYGIKTAAVVDPDGYVIEQVIRANTIEVAPGTIYLYIYNGSTGASTALLNAAQNVLSGYRTSSGQAVPGWKAAGIKSFVFPATELPVNVTFTIEISPGRIPDIVVARCVAAVSDVFSRLDVGETLRYHDLLVAVRQISGVLDVLHNDNTSNTVPNPDQICVPGIVSLSTTDDSA